MQINNVQGTKAEKSRVLLVIDNILRRVMDITLSLIGLTVLSPFFFLIAVAIKRSSPGPVFYWGPRVGKNEKIFRILKFRTMFERKESYEGPKVTAENDPRITPLGRILRQTKINELPQLWNVLVGEMSFVGPRPEDPSIASGWPAHMRKEVFSVKPGITSPASVVYRNEEDLLQSANLMDTYLWDILPTKLRLDQIYLRNRSILTDLDVIIWTAFALVPKMKKFSIPEHLLYWGPLARFTYHYLGWFVVDLLVSFVAVAFAGVLRRLTTPLDLGIEVAIGIALSIALMFSTINALAGLNRINWNKARPQDASDLAISTAAVTLVVLVANFVFPQGARFPISVILASSLLSYFGFVAVRYRTRLLTGFARYWMRLRGKSMTPLGEHVLIVGAGNVARFAVWLLTNENLSQAFTIIGMVDDNPRMIGTKVEGYPVIGTTSMITSLAERHDIGLILFAISDIQPEDQDRILAECQSTKARIIPIPDILENLRAQLPKNEAEREIHFNKVLHNATTDRLTGAYNRQQFLQLANVEFIRSIRYLHPLSIIAIAVDYSRPRKAKYSRAVASQIMQASARRCLKNIRGIDLFGRYAEDILLVLLPETEEDAAVFVARRLKEHIMKETVDTIRGSFSTIAEFSVVTNRTGSFDRVERMIDHAVASLKPRPSTKDVIVAPTQLK